MCRPWFYESPQAVRSRRAPERFDPHSFSVPVRRRAMAYFPFGGVPRSCIGGHFARLAATLLRRTLLTRYRVHSHCAELRRTPLIPRVPRLRCAALTDNVAWGLSALPASHLAVDNRRHNAGHWRWPARSPPLLGMTPAFGYRLRGNASWLIAIVQLVPVGVDPNAAGWWMRGSGSSCPAAVGRPMSRRHETCGLRS
jgi:Cytochrome P450